MDGWGIAGVVGEIVGAAGTVAAVVVALIGTKHARDAQRKAESELTDERARQADAAESAELAARRAQAEKVLAWCDIRSSGAVADDYLRMLDMKRWLYVSNYSGAPIFDVEVWVVAMDNTSLEIATYTVLEPLEAPTPFNLGGRFRPDQGGLTAWMAFRDLAGRTWKRYQSGELVETTAA